MPRRNRSRIPLLTGNVDADSPGHMLPDASVPPITLHHAREAVLPQDPAWQSGQDVRVCVTCHLRCRNDTALRNHGEKEGHKPYGCVCGNKFSRLDILGRHIASKNKVTRFACPLCEYDIIPKTFTRADHLSQHLRTLHKIPAGKIPQLFGADLSHRDLQAEDLMHPQPVPQFPCLISGCPRTGRHAYLRREDLDEHMACIHCPRRNYIQHGLSDVISTYTNYNFQRGAHVQSARRSQQDTQNILFQQLGLNGDVQAEGAFWGNGTPSRNMDLQQHEELNHNRGWDFNLDV
ncbi:hypothetical protein GGR55DRAFT_683420 [Xylaria sp. FL0064]|nr:hypothetical protein GGR55DRAFT_683420 [Xylaria sp. FL0064]